MQYMETSAKNSNNVTELFTAVTGDLVDKNRHKYLADSTLGVIDSSTFITSKPVRGHIKSLNCFDCSIM